MSDPDPGLAVVRDVRDDWEVSTAPQHHAGDEGRPVEVPVFLPL